MVRHESTVGGTQVVDLLDALRALGADTTALLARIGLSDLSATDMTQRVPSARLLPILDAAERALRDPLVGLHAGARVETRGPLFYLLLSSPTLSEGLRMFAQFARVPLDSHTVTIEADAGTVTMTMDLGDPGLERSRHAVDYIVGANVSSIRRAVPGLRLVGVDLTHEEVGAPGSAAAVFGCPVRFGRRRNAIRFADSALARVPIGANPTIAGQIRKYAEAVEAQLGSASHAPPDRVANAVRALIGTGAIASRAAVARRLHVSERTLHRQLEEHDTTFTRIHDGVRAELAQALLANHALKIEAVAHCIGFAEVASFSKAFRRWAGCSPSRYRDRLGPHRDAV